MRIPVYVASLLAALSLLCAPVIAAPAGPDRSKAPTVGPPPALVVPTVVRRELSNGIPVYLIPRSKVPLASVVLMSRTGAAQEAAGKFGLASLTANLMSEGAGSKDSLQFADAVDWLGASLGVSPSYDATFVSLTVPSARLASGLDLMADMVLHPTFPQAELDRLKAEGLTSFLQARKDPGALGSAAYLATLYGLDHRYGVGLSGVAKDFAAFTRADVVDFHARTFRPDRVAFLVTGDVQPDALVALLQARFGSWKASGEAPADGSVGAPSRSAAGIYLVDRPGSPQSVVRVGMVGVPRDTPDYFPLQVANTVLGGSFSSRLNQNLREKNQFTYGARSGFAMRLGPGPFSAAASVQSQSTGPAVAEFLKELEAIRQPIPAEELDRARNYSAYTYPGEFETSGDLAQKLAEMTLYRLPGDYYSTYVPNLLAVTAESAEKAMKAHLDPSKLAIVVVGDAKTVKPQLEALNLGPVNMLTVEEFMGPEVPVPGAK